MLAPEHIVAVCQALRDEFDFEMLAEQTAVDYWPEEQPRFHVVYRLYSFQHNQILSLRVPLNGNAPSVPTIESVYPNANWYRARALGYVRHPLRRSPRSAPHPHAVRLGRSSTAQGLSPGL